MKALVLVGLLYLCSGLWCAWQPELAAGFLGFALTGPMANSEFFSVYGGLQVGLAVAMLCCSRIPAYIEAGLFFSMMFSGTLFLFRLISLVFYGFEEGALLALLVLEAAIALALAITWRRARAYT